MKKHPIPKARIKKFQSISSTFFMEKKEVPYNCRPATLIDEQINQLHIYVETESSKNGISTFTNILCI